MRIYLGDKLIASGTEAEAASQLRAYEHAEFNRTHPPREIPYGVRCAADEFTDESLITHAELYWGFRVEH